MTVWDSVLNYNTNDKIKHVLLLKTIDNRNKDKYRMEAFRLSLSYDQSGSAKENYAIWCIGRNGGWLP